MYVTLWTLRVSPLYVYRHLTLCLSPALDSIYYTLHVLDSMFIVTLCSSSSIIYALLSASYRRTRLRENPESSNFTSRSRVRPGQSMVRVARHADKVQLFFYVNKKYGLFGRSARGPSAPPS